MGSMKAILTPQCWCIFVAMTTSKWDTLDPQDEDEEANATVEMKEEDDLDGE